MRKLIIAVVAVVIVLVVALLVAPFLIPTDTYKAKLIALVKADTGRDLTIAGPVKFSFLPSVELEANDVAFANAPGAQDKDMVQLKKLEIELKVLPLIHGAVELSQFVLTEPQISLEVDKTGKPNWQFAQEAAAVSAGTAPAPGAPAAQPQSASGAPAAQPQSASGALPLSQISLGDMRFVNGRISYRDDRTGKTQVIDAIDMKLSLPNLQSPLAAEGSAQYNGQKLALALGVDKPAALLSGGESGFHIRLDGAPLTVGFTGDMTGLPPKKLGGTVDLTVPSVRGLATWAGSPLPPGPGLGKLAIKGRVDASGTTYRFSNADIAIDAIAGQGAVAVDTGGAVPSLKGSLAVDKLDVNPYLAPETAPTSSAPAPASSSGGGGSAPAPAPPSSGGGGGSAPASAGWSDAPIDFSALKLANADFDVKAGAILYRKIVVGPSALTLHLRGGKFEADLSQLSLYGGQGQGKVSIDGTAATPAIAMNFALSGFAVAPLMQAVANTDRLSGTGKIDFAVAGSGTSQRAIISALNGKGALDISNGAIKGVNLIALATNTAKTVVGGKSGANETDFASLTGTFTITNGILKNSDLAMKSGVVPMTGAGTVDLPNRHVDYRITPSLAGTLQIPIIVSGPWNNLSYRPDLVGVLQGTAKGLVNTPGAILNAVPGVNQLPGVDQLPGGSGSGSSGSNPLNQLKGLFGH